MNLSEYFCSNGNRAYTYVGTLLGDGPETHTGREWAEVIIDLGADGGIIAHPANECPPSDGGWYIEGDSVCWAAPSGEPGTEICFEAR